MLVNSEFMTFYVKLNFILYCTDYQQRFVSETKNYRYNMAPVITNGGVLSLCLMSSGENKMAP